MYAEKTQQESPSRTIQTKPGTGKYMEDNRPEAVRQAKMIDTIQKSDNCTVIQRLPIWHFNDANAVGILGIPRAAMRHYYHWRREIINNDSLPNVAPALDWDAHFEPVGNHFTIRLNQVHRVHFHCDFAAHTVDIIQIGMHDL